MLAVRSRSPCTGGPNGSAPGHYWTVAVVEFERIEAPELLGMTLAHLNDAQASGEVSAGFPLLLAIREELATALREES